MRVKTKNTVKAGDVFSLNQGGSCTVISYLNSANIIIEFNDVNAHKMQTTSSNLRKGQVKNPYHPNIFGVGYLGVGSFNSRTDKGRVYDIWVHIIQRCYDSNFLSKCTAYKGCDVDHRWHNFQIFAEWLVNQKNYGLGYAIDKDLIAIGNKTYSPDKCALVPQEINNLLIDSKAVRGDYLIGVYKFSSSDKFVSKISVNGKGVYLGTFESEIEAHRAYVSAKEDHVKLKAIEYKHMIDPRVFNTLMNWRVRNEK